MVYRFGVCPHGTHSRSVHIVLTGTNLLKKKKKEKNRCTMQYFHAYIGMRQARVKVPGAKYHVCARCVRKEYLLESRMAKALFLSTVEEAKRRFSFRIENFVIMGNHFHLILQPMGNSCLSKIMQWIMGVFAQRFNAKTGSWGHFWGNRFSSWIISSLMQYLRVFFYIDDNPVRAGLVKSARSWFWGGAYYDATKRYEICEPRDSLDISLKRLSPRWI